MRLLITASVFPPEVGGPASYVPSLAAALTERGHDVRVVCRGLAPCHGDRPYPFQLTRIVRHRSRLARAAATVSSIVAHGRAADVIYANGLSLETRAAGRLLGRPVVHKVVGDLAWERARNYGWFAGTLDAYQTAPKSARLRMLDVWRGRSVKDAAAVITPSAYLARIVQAWGVSPGRIHVVYNALPAHPPTLVPVALPGFAGATFITVCRLVPWKGVEELIDVVADLPQVRLLVVGDGPCRRRLETHAQVRRVGPRVLWLGARSAGEVEALLRCADALVLNSSYEGLPHVVLEAMRAAVPVIATAVGGTPEVVLDGVTGRLVRPGDSAGLRAAFQWLLDSPSHARETACAAKKRLLEIFHFDAMVQQTERVLVAAATGLAVAPL